MPQSLEIVLPAAAALFGYLSWKRIAMGNVLDREEVIRNRLKDSGSATNFYSYRLGRVQISEYGGWWYEIWKYLPIVGGIQGETLVYLWFSPPVSSESLQVPEIEDMESHSDFSELPVSQLSWKGDVDGLSDEGLNLELLLSTTNPDDILKSVTDLSSIMIETLSEN